MSAVRRIALLACLSLLASALPAQAQAAQTLSVEKQGSGTGTVTSSPAGINCGPDCQASFPDNATVVLTATPGPNTQAVQWLGCDSLSEGKCSATMSGARKVKALFNLIQRQLTVKREGTGTGMVTSSPAGIDCGATCAASFDHGTTVVLSGTPGALTLPASWTGCGSVNVFNQCEVTMSQAREVKAAFNLSEPILKVAKTGTGAGTVKSSPSGIDCGATCSAKYLEGTTVTLTGAPIGEAEAPLWSGCDSVTAEDKCVVKMSAAREVTASFELPVLPLALQVVGDGAGTVTSAPAGIECAASCEGSFIKGSSATLKGAPGLHTEAVKWSGCDKLTLKGECLVTMSSAREVIATFKLEREWTEHTITVQRKGTGQGAVTSSPAGIDCGADCSETYLYNTDLTLTATPAPGSEFLEWQGGGCMGQSGPCSPKVTKSQSIKAVFIAIGTRTLSVSKAGSGQGVITSKPGGIECGATCSAELDASTKVSLRATASPGSAFAGWSGEGCAGTGACKVTMSEARNVSAAFTTASTPSPYRPRHCRKGFKKRKVKGKVRCVRVKHRHRHRGAGR
jgi:hypothetical protein